MTSSVEVEIIKRLLGDQSSCRYKLFVEKRSQLPWFDFVVCYSGSILRCRLYATFDFACIEVRSSLLARSAGLGLYHAQHATSATSLLTSFLCGVDYIMQRMQVHNCVYATL